MFSSIDTSISKENKGSNISIPSLKGNGDDYVHRLVQDENAKTILLNVPLEINSAVGGMLRGFFSIRYLYGHIILLK